MGISLVQVKKTWPSLRCDGVRFLSIVKVIEKVQKKFQLYVFINVS